eukprot:UN33070
MSVNFVSYNILNPHLCNEQFHLCKPEDRDNKIRFETIKKKLLTYIKSDSIIALQEVCLDWAGPLEVFFKNNNYQFTFGPFSGRHANFMGVAIAFPTNSKNIKLVDIKYVNPFYNPFKERYEQPKQRNFSIPLSLAGLGVTSLALFGSLSKNRAIQTLWCTSLLTSLINIFPKKQPDRFSREADLRLGIQSRERDIMLFLKFEVDGKPFWVSTVHMPCKFWNPKLMYSYAMLLATKVQEVAGKDPYVLMGDFNQTPT